MTRVRLNPISILFAIAVLSASTAVADGIHVTASASTYIGFAPDFTESVTCSSGPYTAQGAVTADSASCGVPHVTGWVEVSTTKSVTFGNLTPSPIDLFSGGIQMGYGGFLPPFQGPSDTSGSGQISLAMDAAYVFSGPGGTGVVSFEVKRYVPPSGLGFGPSPHTSCSLTVLNTLYSCPAPNYQQIDSLYGVDDFSESFQVQYGKPYLLSFQASLQGSSHFMEPGYGTLLYDFVLPDGVTVNTVPETALVPEPATAAYLIIACAGYAMKALGPLAKR